VKIHFGSYGPHTISIVRANELGIALVKYYRKIVAQNRQQVDRIKQYVSSLGLTDDDKIVAALGGHYPGIEMGRLPKGLELLDRVDVIVESPVAELKS
jgi:hypothetical protein